MNTTEQLPREYKTPHGLQRFTFYYHKAKRCVYCLTAVRDAWLDQPEVCELVEIKDRTADEIVTSMDIPLTEFKQRLATGVLMECQMKPII